MNEHLSNWDQEEYVLGQRTPNMITHLQDCPECRAKIAGLENGLSSFRDAARSWSAQSLAKQTTQRKAIPSGLRTWSNPLVQLAAAAMLLLVLFVLHPWKRPRLQQLTATRASTTISDDALLEQVDSQLSVAVPSSMESLTHLVDADAPQGSKISSARSHQHVQVN